MKACLAIPFYQDIVDLLLEHGANVNHGTKDVDGEKRPLSAAIKNVQPSLVRQLLLAGASPEFKLSMSYFATGHEEMRNILEQFDVYGWHDLVDKICRFHDCRIGRSCRTGKKLASETARKSARSS